MKAIGATIGGQEGLNQLLNLRVAEGDDV
jgi:hypothetical protein